MLDRLKEYLASLPDRRKRVREKFSLQNFKQAFRQENLFDEMTTDKDVRIES